MPAHTFRVLLSLTKRTKCTLLTKVKLLLLPCIREPAFTRWTLELGIPATKPCTLLQQASGTSMNNALLVPLATRNIKTQPKVPELESIRHFNGVGQAPLTSDAAAVHFVGQLFEWSKRCLKARARQALASILHPIWRQHTSRHSASCSKGVNTCCSFRHDLLPDAR